MRWAGREAMENSNDDDQTSLRMRVPPQTKRTAKPLHARKTRGHGSQTQSINDPLR